MKIDNKDLLLVYGGSISSTMLNAISRLITTLLDLGRTIGTSLNRYKNKTYCN